MHLRLVASVCIFCPVFLCCSCLATFPNAEPITRQSMKICDSFGHRFTEVPAKVESPQLLRGSWAHRQMTICTPMHACSGHMDGSLLENSGLDRGVTLARPNRSFEEWLKGFKASTEGSRRFRTHSLGRVHPCGALGQTCCPPGFKAEETTSGSIAR